MTGLPAAPPWQDRLPGIAAAVGLHALALVALLHYQPMREAIATAAPIMVSMVTPPQVEPVPAPLEPPKPLPQKQRVKPRPVEKPRLVATPVAAAPTEFVTPAPPPEPAPPPRAPAAAPEPAPAAVLPLVPPNFNADYLHNPAPPYPPLARRMNEQGRVVLRVLVNADGFVEQVELRTSSGSSRLDQSALETVRTWKFVPARRGNSPVAAWVLVPISFSLQG
jgi:protein TonB